MADTQGAQPSRERLDLIESLDRHRRFLRQTVRGLSDEEAGRRTTVSELCLGGLLKHVAATESRWVDFILEGPSVMTMSGPADYEAYAGTFRMGEGDTVEGLLDAYGEVARRTNELVASLPSLDLAQPLPEAPWFEPGAQWSARRVVLHIIAETSQHAGHADIIREALDGAKTMG
jgi:uncharacterized damage-inducible protein DinB